MCTSSTTTLPAHARVQYIGGAQHAPSPDTPGNPASLLWPMPQSPCVFFVIFSLRGAILKFRTTSEGLFQHPACGLWGAMATVETFGVLSGIPLTAEPRHVRTQTETPW